MTILRTTYAILSTYLLILAFSAATPDSVAAKPVQPVTRHYRAISGDNAIDPRAHIQATPTRGVLHLSNSQAYIINTTLPR